MMKKSLFFLVVILMASLSLYAQQQKSYVTVLANQERTSNYCYVTLSGDIPQSMKEQYGANDFDFNISTSGRYWIGKVLNLLAENGFTVEQMNTTDYTNYSSSSSSYMSSLCTTYLLSRPYTPSSSTSKIEVVNTSSPEDITEVARYNLQGLPVTPADKGIQIIVYSNYTTKTIISE